MGRKFHLEKLSTQTNPAADVSTQMVFVLLRVTNGTNMRY